jgi:NADPH:quinone reductase-like Zn-dependent oxidoreductase
MKRVVYTKKGDLSVISLVDEQPPTAKAGEVVIEVHRAGINFADLMMRQGLYGAAPDFPFTPGYEVSGIITQVGAGVGGQKVGDRVIAMTGFGGYAEQVVVDESRIIPIPDDISFDAAAAMPVTYATAHHMLSYLGNFQAGDTVLIHHAGGGVGTAVAQLAKALGAGIIIGTASASKREFVESLGMRFVDKDSEDFVAICKQLTDGKGVHHALDPVGGKHLMRSYKALRSGGRVYCFGASSAVSGEKRSLFAALKMLRGMPKFDPLRMMNSNKSVFGVHMGTWDDEDVMRSHLTELSELLRDGKISPIVDKVFRYEEVAQAQKYIHDRKNRGKVLLDFSPR